MRVNACRIRWSFPSSSSTVVWKNSRRFTPKICTTKTKKNFKSYSTTHRVFDETALKKKPSLWKVRRLHFGNSSRLWTHLWLWIIILTRIGASGEARPRLGEISERKLVIPAAGASRESPRNLGSASRTSRALFGRLSLAIEALSNRATTGFSARPFRGFSPFISASLSR